MNRKLVNTPFEQLVLPLGKATFKGRVYMYGLCQEEARSLLYDGKNIEDLLIVLNWPWKREDDEAEKMFMYTTNIIKTRR